MVYDYQKKTFDTLQITNIIPDNLLPKKVKYNELFNDSTIVYVPMDFSSFADGYYILATLTKDPGEPGWSIVGTLPPTTSSGDASTHRHIVAS